MTVRPGVTLKYVIIALILIAPLAVLTFFNLRPEADLSFNLPLFHFYIVTFTTFSAVVISILLGAALGAKAQPRHVLAAVAFAATGSVFFLHGLATPNALIDTIHPAHEASAWLTFLVGGVLFFLASLDRANGAPRWLHVRAIVNATGALLAIYFAIAFISPQWLEVIGGQVAPTSSIAFLILTVGLWMLAAFLLARTWLVTRNRVDGMLAFVAFWMGQAAVSLLRAPAWHLSWWLHPFILLVSFLFIAVVLVSEYEQARKFRLMRYFLAASLILTALLGLIGSSLYAEFSYQQLVERINTSSKVVADHLTSHIVTDLKQLNVPLTVPGLVDYLNTRASMPTRLAGLLLQSATVYDLQGNLVYTGQAQMPGMTNTPANDPPAKPKADFDPRTIKGTLVNMVSTEAMPAMPPNQDSMGMNMGMQIQRTVETLSPIRPSGLANGEPLAILLTVHAVPELEQEIIQARATGLAISALTMGLLFLILLLVVRRADHIIVNNTNALTMAYDNLQRAEGMRDHLTNMIVHDLRNPLHAIRSSLELLKEYVGAEDIEARDELVDAAGRAAKRISIMIDDMLTVSKMEAGELKPQLASGSLNDLLAERVSGFSRQAASEGKQIVYDSPDNLLVVMDSTLIGRVVDNLIDNALKYTWRGGTIRVKVGAENDRVRVSVRDDGAGVPDAFKQRIFEKFFQVPEGDGSVRKGVGLGLAFCRLVIEAHGGKIDVHDGPGGGSDFSFWLPLKQATAVPASPATPVTRAGDRDLVPAM